MAKGGQKEGLVLKFGYDLSSGMDEGLREFYASMNRLEQAAKKRQVKVKIDWSANQKDFNKTNTLISTTITLIKQAGDMARQVGGDFTKMSVDQKKAYDGIVKAINENILKINEFTKKLNDMPVTMQTSVAAMRRQLASLSAQWDEMSVGEKFSGKGFTRMSAEAKRLLKEYVKLQKQMEKHGSSIDMVARKDRESALLRKKNLTTEAEYLERIRILEERIAKTKIGTDKYNRYKQQLTETSAKLDEIHGKQKVVNESLYLTDAQMKRLNDSFKLADHYTGLLLIRLAAYAGVAMFARMLRNIKDITAEFELQKVALGAVIQDTEKASTLFAQIKAQAVRSPFEVKELVTYTKQLAAYRVESERLFDVTMQLADISSALGVDMQRLILAYGQVKAASVLRGQELRQFTEAGIPLVQKLADKFTELRGRVVSTGEVFELISRRAVSFGMIEQIFNDMTSAGGEFYRMQEKQAETLKGRWTNLKDAISIAYDEIGRSAGIQNLLNGLIDTVSSLAKNWRAFSTAINISVKSLAIFAVSAKSMKTAMSALTGAELAHAIAEKKLTLASGERLRVWQLEAAASEAEFEALRRASILKKKAAQENNIFTASVLRLRAAYEKMGLSMSTAMRDLRYIKYMRQYDALMIKAARSTSLLTASMYKLAAGVKRLWASIGPVGWIIMGLTAIVTVLRKLNREAKDFDKFVQNAESAVAAHETMVKRIKNVEDMANTYEALAKKTERTEAESKKLSSTIKTLTDMYPHLSGVTKDYIKDVDNVIEKIKQLSDAQIESELKYLKALRDKTSKELKKAKKEFDKYFFIKYSTQPYVSTWGGLSMKPADLEDYNKAKESVDNLTEKLQDLDDIILGLTDDGKKAEVEWTGWQAKVLTFTKSIESMKNPIAAIYPDELQSLSNITDVWEKAAKTWKEQQELITEYNNSLKQEHLGEQERQQIKDALEYAEAVAEVNYKLLEYYNQLDLLKDKGGSGNKPDTSMFKDELDLVKRIYKKYVDLRKIQSEGEARKDIAATYGNLTAIDFLSPKELAKRIANIRARAIAFAAQTTDEDVRKAIQDFVNTADEEIDNVSYTELENAIKERLDNLAKDIATADEAGKFYEEVFGKTFDRGLAEAFTASVYGADRTNATKALKSYISEVFGEATAFQAFDPKAYGFNWSFLEGMITEDMPEEVQKRAREIIASGRKASQEQYRQWMTDLAKEKDVLDKRIDLHHQTVQRIREIEMNANITETQRKDLIEQYRKREEKLSEDIARQAFKESPIYSQLFEDLDSASAGMLRRLKQGLEELNSEWEDLDPSDLKELRSRIEALDEELTQRNPFGTLVKSLKAYYAAGAKAKRRNADMQAILSDKAMQSARDEAIEKANELEAAEQRLRDMEEGRLKASESDVENQKKQIANLRLETGLYRDLYEAAKKRSDADAEDADYWRYLNELIMSSASIIVGYSDQLTKMNDLVFRVAQAWGDADDAQKEYLNNLKAGIDEMIEGVANLGKGILEIKGGNYFEGIVDVIVGLERTIEGALNTARAQEIRDITREIKAQDDALENLEKSYERLRKQEDKVFGTEFIANRRREFKVMEAEAEAYRKKADAMMQMPKKDRDEEQAREWYKKADEILENLGDRYDELAQKFFGTDAASAARDFASAWLDAYKSYSNTLDAMNDKFREMVENMIKESIMAKVMQPFIDKIMEPIYKLDDEEEVDTETMLKALDQTLLNYKSSVGAMDDAMNAVVNVMRARGVDLRDSASGLKGISKDIAQASEQSILGLAAGINTQNFYISGIYSSVGQIVALLQGGTVTKEATAMGTALDTKDYTIRLTNIENNTTSIDRKLSNILSALSSVTSVSGGVKRINVNMNQ